MPKWKPSTYDLPSHTALQSYAISLSVLIFDLPPLDYTVDIEVSLMDSSFLEPIKEYFKNLNLSVSTNISNVEMTVSNINITTGGLVIYFCILGDVLFCQYLISPSFTIHHTSKSAKVNCLCCLLKDPTRLKL